METCKIVVTGAASGIGRTFCEYALTKGTEERRLEIYGIDKEPYQEKMSHNIHGQYASFYPEFGDVRDVKTFPIIPNVNVLINNAGIQGDETINCWNDVIATNLTGVRNCTEFYALHNRHIKSIVNLASVSAHTGAEFSAYVASKGGVLAYTKRIAKQLAPIATCNSISFGGVVTPLNTPVLADRELWHQIMDETPMKRWATAEEATEWIWFVSMVNKSMTAQDIVIDNGEMFNHNFIWTVNE